MAIIKMQKVRAGKPYGLKAVLDYIQNPDKTKYGTLVSAKDCLLECAYQQMHLVKQDYAAAVYCRLSRDDGTDSESNSIQTQRQMLRRYASENGFSIYDEYVDDGYSGTTFDRPDFNRMIQDIGDGHVNVIITKDLSRLGRNNALVAHYTEIFFPENDIRYIAVTDGIDTVMTWR